MAARETVSRDRPRDVTLGRLRRRCEAKLRELDLVLPVPFTLEGFCQTLGQRLGRPIVLCPVDTRTGPCGLWVATDTTDFFLYERATIRLHKELIVGHEAGHRVFGHHSAEVLDEELASLLGLNVELVRRVLGRQSYSRPEEQLAEVFGTMIVERAVREPASRQSEEDPEAAAVLKRVEAALTRSGDGPGNW